MNNKFEWKDEYLIGIREIDKQHIEFFDLANKLIEEASSENVTYSKLRESLEDLGDYAVYHLGSEEKLFEEYNYPDKNDHFEAHENFRKEISKMMQDSISGKENDVKMYIKLANFANEWLINHISTKDRKFGQFIRKNNKN